MLINLAIAAGMFTITTVIHSVGMIWQEMLFHPREGTLKKFLHDRPVLGISTLVIVMFLILLLEAMVWALTYRLLGAIPDLETAIYFSMVTYTTLGYGDVLLEGRWRLLGSIEAANGIIMFGWTTAILMTSIRQIYPADSSGRNR